MNKKAGVEAKNVLREGSKRVRKKPSKLRDFI